MLLHTAGFPLCLSPPERSLSLELDHFIIVLLSITLYFHWDQAHAKTAVRSSSPENEDLHGTKGNA